MAGRKAVLDYAGYTILHGIADPLIANLYMHRAAGMLNNYAGVKVNELYSTFLQIISSEEALKDESKPTLRKPIINHAKSFWDQQNRNSEIGQYSSTKKLLIDHMVSVEEGKYVKAQATLNVG